MQARNLSALEGEFEVSFGYKCSGSGDYAFEVAGEKNFKSDRRIPKNRSFSCLSGAALKANATLANTSICNGLLGGEILPTWDSPTSFRKVPSLPNLSKLEFLSSLSCTPSSPEDESFLQSSRSRFHNVMEVQVAGGAAGEDRVQAVCCEENGWLFCGIYDGFNGRDAADFLAATLYETILSRTSSSKLESHTVAQGFDFRPDELLSSLKNALIQAENDYLRMVEQEMEIRPDLVSVGSCVLVGLLHGSDLYVLNLGDSRAVLATQEPRSALLQAVQLTESHTVDDVGEKARLLADHPDDKATIVSGRVKGKLKVTRAFGVGYLKRQNLNDALMGILRVRNLISPPYVSSEPAGRVHRITKSDHFIIFGSDGLFDFFSNEESVSLVSGYIARNPNGDPAKFLLEELLARAAHSAGFTVEELTNIPAGRRRKYHDDVTVIVVILGSNPRTSRAST